MKEELFEFQDYCKDPEIIIIINKLIKQANTKYFKAREILEKRKWWNFLQRNRYIDLLIKTPKFMLFSTVLSEAKISFDRLDEYLFYLSCEEHSALMLASYRSPLNHLAVRNLYYLFSKVREYSA